MKHYCPMCGEQWNEDKCASCGWYEGMHSRWELRDEAGGVRKVSLFLQKSFVAAILPIDTPRRCR